MIKPVISVDQLVWLAYNAGLQDGLRKHIQFQIDQKTMYGMDLIAEYTRDGVLEFNKMISEGFVVDY